jgi:hypothetical protein
MALPVLFSKTSKELTAVSGSKTAYWAVLTNGSFCVSEKV